MSQIQAIYRHGVFEPLEPVDLDEDQRVELTFEKPKPTSMKDWLKEVSTIHARIIAEHGGPLPDSTPDIAADRLR